MALPSLHLSKKQRKKRKEEPYNPLSNKYKNRLEFEDDVNRMTALKVKPKINSLTQQGEEARREHKGREVRNTGMYDYYDQKVAEARDAAQAAADRLITANSGMTAASQANLDATLASTRAANADTAMTAGGNLDTTQPDAAAAQSAATGTLLAGGNNSIATQNAQQAAAEVATQGLRRVSGEEDEAAKFKALIEAIHAKRTDAKGEIGDIRAAVAKELEDAALARQTEKNREQIAEGALENEGKQVGVAEQEADTNATKAQTEIERLRNEEAEGKANLQLGWAAIRNEKAKLHAEVKAAGSVAEKEAAEAAARQYTSATEAMAQYFANTRPKAQKPHALFRTITATGLGKKEALELMGHAANPSIVEWARKELRVLNGEVNHTGDNTGPEQGRIHR